MLKKFIGTTLVLALFAGQQTMCAAETKLQLCTIINQRESGLRFLHQNSNNTYKILNIQPQEAIQRLLHLNEFGTVTLQETKTCGGIITLPASKQAICTACAAESERPTITNPTIGKQLYLGKVSDDHYKQITVNPGETVMIPGDVISFQEVAILGVSTLSLRQNYTLTLN